jgi:hypothetical protein
VCVFVCAREFTCYVQHVVTIILNDIIFVRAGESQNHQGRTKEIHGFTKKIYGFHEIQESNIHDK